MALTQQWLDSLRATSDLTKDTTSQFNALGSNIDALRKQADYKKLGADIPEMVANGDWRGIAGRTAAMGDMSLTKDIMDKQTAIDIAKIKDQTASAKNASMDFEKLKTLYGKDIPDDKLLALVGQPVDKQVANLKQMQGFNEGGRRTKQAELGFKETATKDFDKLHLDFQKDEADFNQIKKSIDAGTLPADAAVFNFLARKVSSDKGPLSDSDVNRFVGKAFEGDVQKFQNFVSGGSTSALTPQQRDAYRELLKNYGDSLQQKKATILGGELQGAIANNPDLVKNGKPDASIADRLKRAGLTYNAKSGAIESKPVSRTIPKGYEWISSESPDIQQKLLSRPEMLTEANIEKIKANVNAAKAAKQQ